MGLRAAFDTNLTTRWSFRLVKSVFMHGALEHWQSQNKHSAAREREKSAKLINKRDNNTELSGSCMYLIHLAHLTGKRRNV